MNRSVPQKAARLALASPGTPARRAAKSQPAAREPRVISEGRYRITARPDRALVIAWFPDDDEGGGVITLPPMIGVLLERAAAGEQISPAMVLRAMRG